MVRMEREQSRMTPWMFEQLRAELLAEIENGEGGARVSGLCREKGDDVFKLDVCSLSIKFFIVMPVAQKQTLAQRH